MAAILNHNLVRWMQWYSAKTYSNPVVTKALTSLSLFGLGDVLAQTISDQPFDRLRSLRMACYGLLVAGPVSHFWYNFLDKMVEKRLRIRQTKAVIAKIAFDQLVYTPPMTMVFFSYMTLTAGGDLRAALQSIKVKLLPTLKVNYVVWPLVHTITFGVIPLEFRVLFIAVASMFWACFLSLMSTKRNVE